MEDKGICLMARLYKVEYRFGIQAPVDYVYDILADVEKWPTWSPIHKEARAQLGFGAPAAFKEEYEGLGTWELDGALSDWVPLSHMHFHIPRPWYVGQLIRYYEVDNLLEVGTRFSMGAAFGGLLSEREGKRFAPYLRKGFEAFTHELKARAEQAYANDPNATLRAPAQKPPERIKKQAPRWGNPSKPWGEKRS